MVLGWQISPVWELILWVCLAAFFTSFFYMIFFGFGSFTKSVWSDLQKYEKAWWNQKAVAWICFMFIVLTIAPSFATSVLGFFFQGLHLPWSLFAALDAVARNSPSLLFVLVAITAPMSSFFIVWLLLSAIPPSKGGVWLAKHFTQVFIGTALSLAALQSFLLLLALNACNR